MLENIYLELNLKHRLFISLFIPDNIKNQIIEMRKSIISNDSLYRWEKEEKFHITLKFIGDTDPSNLEKIINSLSFLESKSKLTGEFDRFDFFYKGKNPRILWLGIKLNDEVYTIVDELNMKLEKLKIPKEEKRFKSHLTILRMRGTEGNEFVSMFKNFELDKKKFSLSEIHLMESKLLPSGSVYKKIKNYNLI
jgi:2'-5' RNA ligase